MTHSSPPALPAKKAATTYTAPKFSPISDEVTPYGARKFRTPVRKDEFKGKQGSAFEAIVFDIDGTLQSWGSSADKDILTWAQGHYKKGRTFIVITARGEGMYQSSFNWLMHEFPYPFIGPFVRADDDPRFASEFKRELAQGFEDIGLYQIVGAADDNKYVIDMWKQWATDHFDKPEDFDLFEAVPYSDYGDWRKDLPSKGTTYSSGYNYSSGSYSSGSYSNTEWDSIKKEYVPKGTATPAHWDKDLKRMVPDEPAAKTPEGKHRQAGVTRWEKNTEDAAPGKVVYLAHDPTWAAYFAARDKAGAYLGTDRSLVPLADEVSEVLDTYVEDGRTITSSSLMREDLEDVVAHNYPGYTPTELESMSDEELRELAGITVDEYHDILEEDIEQKFGGRFYGDELDNLSVAQLEEMLTMEFEDAERLVDDMWVATRGHLDDPVPVASQQTTAERYRSELENEVYAAYEDLSTEDVRGMKDEALEWLADNAEQLKLATDPHPATQPLDVVEVLGEFAEEPTDIEELRKTQAQAQEGHVA